MNKIKKFCVFLALLPIYLYQFFLSPFLGRQCNFYPTCSNYAILAIKKYGIFIGIKKSIMRILKCNPSCKTFEHDEP